MDTQETINLTFISELIPTSDLEEDQDILDPDTSTESDTNYLPSSDLDSFGSNTSIFIST